MNTNWFVTCLFATVALAASRTASAQQSDELFCEQPAQGCRTGEAASAKLGGQMFFRFGGGWLTDGPRSREVFTDAGGAGRRNDDKSGLSLGFGLDIPLFKDPFGNTVLGEMLIDYAQFSDRRVVQATSVLLGAPAVSDVMVNQLGIVAAPKYRIELGKLRPWIIPVGMEFLVNSPPTNDAAYLDYGLHLGAGIDYMLSDDISIGVDWRYHLGANVTNSSSPDFMTAGGYIGFNF